MKTVARVATLLVVATAVRVDEEDVSAKPGHKKMAEKIAQQVMQHDAKIEVHMKDRREEIVDHAAKMATNFAHAHKMAKAKAELAVTIQHEKKLVLDEAAEGVKVTTKTLHHAKKLHAKAIEEQKARVAKEHASSEGYAQAWGKADALEKQHAAALKKKEETAAAAAEVHAQLAEAKAEKSAADSASKKAQHLAAQHLSMMHAQKAHVKALEIKGIQLIKHKGKVEAYATQAALAKDDAAKEKADAKVTAQEAAAEQGDAAEAAKESKDANYEARGVSNLKTGIAYRAMKDTLDSKAKATRDTEVAQELKNHADAVKAAGTSQAKAAQDDEEEEVEQSADETVQQTPQETA